MIDTIQQYLQKQEWYDNLDALDKIDVLESFYALINSATNVNDQKGKRWTAEAKLLLEKEKSRKLYHACNHAYLWHCGNGSEQAEKDCMHVLAKAIEAYNK